MDGELYGNRKGRTRKGFASRLKQRHERDSVTGKRQFASMRRRECKIARIADMDGITRASMKGRRPLLAPGTESCKVDISY